jgi:hypothetical protein
MSIKDFSFLVKVLFLVLAIALFTAACGSSEPDDGEVSIPLPGGSSLSLDKDGGEFNIKNDEGSFHMKANAGGVEYPAELESEFPACPNCTPVQASNLNGSIGVMLRVDGSMEDAHNFYIEKAKAAGYTGVMNNQMEGLWMFMAQKGDATLTLNTGVNDDGSVFVNLRIM